MALASMAMPGPLSPRCSWATGKAGAVASPGLDTAEAHEQGRSRADRAQNEDDDAVMGEVAQGGVAQGEGGCAAGGAEGRGDIVGGGPVASGRRAEGEGEAFWEAGGALVGSAEGAGGDQGGWVAAAAALAAGKTPALTTAEDLEWSASTLRSLESLVESSQAEKLLPAGRILWLLREHGGRRCQADAGSRTREGSGEGMEEEVEEVGTPTTTTRGGARAAADDAGEEHSPGGNAAAGAQEHICHQELKGSRSMFGKLVFTRSMLTDHMPMSYMQALDGELLCRYVAVQLSRWTSHACLHVRRGHDTQLNCFEPSQASMSLQHFVTVPARSTSFLFADLVVRTGSPPISGSAILSPRSRI